MIKKYREKRIAVEAIQYNGRNWESVCSFVGGLRRGNDGKMFLEIETLKGDMKARIGDYIIKDIKGEFHSYKPDIFEQTYKPLNTDYDEED